MPSLGGVKGHALDLPLATVTIDGPDGRHLEVTGVSLDELVDQLEAALQDSP